MAEKLNDNLQFEFYQAERDYASPAVMTETARERIKQRNTRLGKLALAALKFQA
ncbi:MAG: hypothetical protein Q4B65_01685 [Candidatus Saccharibacteria bacterium]|nr:hypothetical protein [Candidatus Saccharibacteria bacterium]